jgi:chloride channel protein, CIC family
VLPIMATCLLARAASSIFSRKPVYRALADKLIEGYERELARRASEEHDDERATAMDLTSSVDDPATPIPPAVAPDDHTTSPSPGH